MENNFEDTINNFVHKKNLFQNSHFVQNMSKNNIKNISNF